MSHEETDFSLLDRPEILRFVFYPRKESLPPRLPGARDYLIEVASGVKVGCRFYPADGSFPTVLFFHGNGEIAADYDYVAPLFNRLEINLFVAEYRGYGFSDGEPSIGAMMHDAHVIFHRFLAILGEEGYRESVFLMGRSLGSASAVELAFHHQERLKGLIIESGFGDMRNLFRHLGFLYSMPGAERILDNAAKIAGVRLPTLIIHAEYDSLIPLEHALTLHERCGADDKRLVIIPGADHNNVMLVDMELYFREVGDFVRTYA